MLALCHLLLMSRFKHVSVNGIARKTAVLLLLNSLSTVFDLRVSCLGGPVIDAWDGDWILNPVPEVWQLTPSLLITSFTQATGLLCLGPHNTTFSYWDFCQQCSQPLCFHMSSVAAHLSCWHMLFNMFFIYTYYKNDSLPCLSGHLCTCGDNQVIGRWLAALAPPRLHQSYCNVM